MREMSQHDGLEGRKRARRDERFCTVGGAVPSFAANDRDSKDDVENSNGKKSRCDEYNGRSAS